MPNFCYWENRLDEASRIIEDLLKKSPQDPEALIQKGQLLLRQKKADEAITTLQTALKNAPQNGAGHYYLGVAYSEKGNALQAEGEWRQAVRMSPIMPEAWLALCASISQRSDWRSLEDLSGQWKKSSPNSVDAYLYHATALVRKGDALGAEADLTHLLQVAPQNPRIYVKLGELRLSQKRTSDAENLFRQALTRDPNSMEATYGLVMVDMQKNKPSEAQELIQQQIAKNPNNPALYFLQARLFFQLKDPDKAEASVTHMLTLNDKDANGLVFLAQVQLSRGKTDQAISNYQRVIELQSNDVRPYEALGRIYEQQGNWQQAQTYYQKAVTLQPENALVSNNLAFLMLERGGSVNVALTLAQTARKGLPNLPNTADTLGWAYYHNGAYSLAAPLLQEAVKKVPGNQTYRYHLGLTYQKLKDDQAAKTEFEKALPWIPNHP